MTISRNALLARGYRFNLTLSRDFVVGFTGGIGRTDGRNVMSGGRTRVSVLVAALLLPLAGLALLLAVPALDVQWEHHPSHFWLVLTVAFVDTVLGIAMSEAATRRDDVRLFLVSLALLASAGFLALHALATPEVLVHEPNNGFVIATPIGLFLAAGFAAASAMQPEHGPGTLSRSARRWIRWVLMAVLVAWAAGSLSGVSFLRGSAPSEAPTPLRIAAPIAIGLYAFAATRYLALHVRRRRPLPLAMATAFVLLAEAVLAIMVARSWHATWWEWHVLMAVAFVVILLTARAEYEHEGSITAAFGGLYMERTLERIDQRQADSLTAMVESIRSEAPLAPVMERLLADGMSAEEVASLERSARELVRVDTLFSPYVGPHLAARLHEEPAFGDLGGKETDVTVLFADLAGFTAFSEGKSASEVIEMLNRYWEGVVPVVVEREGGLIERFAGDAIMAVFNALDDQPDHALRGAAAALAMQAYTQRTAAEHPDWPRFRIGLNTGTAMIGTVGATGQRSFAAIGDTTNVAARVQALAEPGQVLLAGPTYDRIRERVRVAPRRSESLKGRATAVDVYELKEVKA